MRKGAKITADTFYHMTKIIKPGITEFDLLAEMLYFFHKSGVKPSFEPITATGPNSSLPHATISNRKVQNGDFVTMDFRRDLWWGLHGFYAHSRRGRGCAGTPNDL